MKITAREGIMYPIRRGIVPIGNFALCRTTSEGNLVDYLSLSRETEEKKCGGKELSEWYKIKESEDIRGDVCKTYAITRHIKIDKFWFLVDAKFKESILAEITMSPVFYDLWERLRSGDIDLEKYNKEAACRIDKWICENFGKQREISAGRKSCDTAIRNYKTFVSSVDNNGEGKPIKIILNFT